MDLSALRNLCNASPTQDQQYVVISGRRNLSQAEKQWRMDNGRCTFCAESGHTFQQCTTGNQHNGPTFPIRGAATNLAADSGNQGLPGPPPIPARPGSPNLPLN